MFSGCKVFTATIAKERARLGDEVTKWIEKNPDKTIVDKVVTQSSDAEFHCLSISVFYR